MVGHPVIGGYQLSVRASVSGRMDVIYVRILLPYAEKFDPGRMT